MATTLCNFVTAPNWYAYPGWTEPTPLAGCGVRHMPQLALFRPHGLDVSPGTSHAAENCERHKEIHLTSSVAIDYAANLRCTLTSSTSPNHSWRVCGRFACVR